MKIKKRLVALYSLILTAICSPAMAFIDNDGTIDVSSSVTTLVTNVYAIAEQVFPVIIAVVIVALAIKIFRRVAR